MQPHARSTIAALLGLAAAASAQAQTSSWTARAGAAHVRFSTQADVSVNGALVPGGGASASNNTTLGTELAYQLTPQWAARLLLGVPPESTLSGTGALASAGTLGKVTYGPAVLSATYQFADSATLRPYLGLGVNYTIVFKSRDAFIAGLDVKSAFGAVAQAGVEYVINPQWSVSLDARKIFLKTKADGTLPAMGGATAHADVRLDPLVVFLALGRRF